MSDDTSIFRFAVGAGDINFRRERIGSPTLRFYRPRRVAKARGSSTTAVDIDVSEIADVHFTTLGGPFRLSIIPNTECAARLAELGWPNDDLVVVADPREKRELERRLMVLHFRCLVDEVGLIGSAPETLVGLNGSMSLTDTTVTLRPDGTADVFEDLADVVYEFDDIVDSYLHEQGSLLYLQIFDEASVQMLAGGEGRYMMQRSLLMDLGQWPQAAPFYERLPRFGDRLASDLREPEDNVLLAALEQWRQRKPPPAALGGIDLVEQLERLSALKASGALSPDEFDAAKARLLQ